ncbi:MAG: hypothetical protein JW795_04770 [Chitinivibrionales bacterium]|nr:hypothetical protein [Chitinivibrionales bacterium]
MDTKSTLCHNRLLIERYYSKELDSVEAQRAAQHCAQCQSCRDYYVQLSQTRDMLLREHPFEELDARVTSVVRKSSQPWYIQAASSIQQIIVQPLFKPIFAFIVLLCFIVPWFFWNKTPSSDLFRTKGTDQISFLFKRAGVIYSGDQTKTYASGDIIQILYNSSTSQYLHMASIDSRGTLSFYPPEPNSGRYGISIERGANLSYPVSITLDSTPGYELIIAVFSPKMRGKEEITHWLLPLFDRYGARGESLQAALIDEKGSIGRVVETLLLKKDTSRQ